MEKKKGLSKKKKRNIRFWKVTLPYLIFLKSVGTRGGDIFLYLDLDRIQLKVRKKERKKKNMESVIRAIGRVGK